MKNLYEIKAEYLHLLEKTEELLSSDELNENEIKDINSQLTINSLNLKDKVLAYSQYIQNTENDINCIDNEIERLKKLKKTKENLINKLKTNLIESFNTFNIQKLDLTIFKLSLRESESVNSDEWVNYWETKVKNVYSKLEAIVLNDSDTFADCLTKVKELFKIEIKITANKKALKEEILNNQGKAFLSTITKKQNILIK